MGFTNMLPTAPLIGEVEAIDVNAESGRRNCFTKPRSRLACILSICIDGLLALTLSVILRAMQFVVMSRMQACASTSETHLPSPSWTLVFLCPFALFVHRLATVNRQRFFSYTNIVASIIRCALLLLLIKWCVSSNMASVPEQEQQQIEHSESEAWREHLQFCALIFKWVCFFWLLRELFSLYGCALREDCSQQPRYERIMADSEDHRKECWNARITAIAAAAIILLCIVAFVELKSLPSLSSLTCTPVVSHHNTDNTPNLPTQPLAKVTVRFVNTALVNVDLLWLSTNKTSNGKSSEIVMASNILPRVEKVVNTFVSHVFLFRDSATHEEINRVKMNPSTVVVTSTKN